MTQDEIIRMAQEAGFYKLPVDERLKRFAALVAALVAAHEREVIMDEWWMCVDSDLESGVKSLNERAAKKWREVYPAISGFGEFIRARGEK